MDAGRARFVDDLARRLRDEPSVEFAVVFGSTATGEVRPSSDLDVGVKFTDGLSSAERFRRRCFLSGELQRSEMPFVDVSDVTELPLPVARDAVNGEFLCGDERAFERFKTTIEAEFAERRHDLERHQDDVIARIAERGLHG